jgi:hypothetical protein
MESQEAPAPAERGSFGGPPARRVTAVGQPARHGRARASSGLADQVEAPESQPEETGTAQRSDGLESSQERAQKTARTVDVTPVADRFRHSGE